MLGLSRRVIWIYRDAFSGLSRGMWLLSFAMLVNRAGTMVLPFLSLYLTAERGFSTVQAGQLLGLFGLGSIVGSWLGGWLSDRVDPNRIQQVSLLASGVAFSIIPQLESFAAIGTGVMLLTITGDAFRPALFVAATRYSEPLVRARAFALLRLATNVGMSIGPAVGGLLAMHDYRWIFYGDALTCWAAAAILFLMLGAAPRGTEATDADEPAPLPRSAWKDGPFVAFLGLNLLFAMAFFQVFSTLPLYLRGNYGLEESSIGGLLAINAVLIAMFEMVIMRGVEDHNPLRIVRIGALLTCAGLALLPLGPPVSIALLSTIVWSAGEMLSLPLTNAVVALRAGANSTGSYMGAYMVVFSMAFVLGPITGTAVYERFGPNALWFGIGALGILLWLGYSALARFFGGHRAEDAAKAAGER